MYYEYKLVELVNDDAAIESYINDVARQGWRIHSYINRLDPENNHVYDITKILFERAR